MNSAVAYKYDDHLPLPTATKQRVVTSAKQAANDGIYYIGSIQNHPTHEPHAFVGRDLSRRFFSNREHRRDKSRPTKNQNRTGETTIASGNTTLHKTYTYNTRNQLTRVTDSVTPANDAVYAFDANGNQTRKTQAATQTDFTYDVKDQLLSVSRNAANLGLFSYDYQGHRIVKDMGGSIVRYAYDGNSVLLETDTSGTTLAKFDYGPDRLLSMTHASEGRAYYLFDALGSVANLTTSAGAIQARYQYDAYGNYRNTDGASFNRFGFTGHEKDNETNLYYFKARYYDPDTGRFLNQDAYLGDVNTPPSLHRYLYAYGNPTVYVDLDGYESISASIDSAAEGCGAWSCAGWALAKGAYAASTFGFAVVHDPVSDQLDKGEITLSQYISRGIFGGAAMVGVNVAGVALGGMGSGATATLASTMARSAVTGGAISGGTDAVTQGVNIAAGLQDNYDVGRTAIATGAGAALGGMVPAAAAGLATPTVKAITSKVANAVSDTVANAGQAAKSVLTYEGKNLNVGSVPATVSGSVKAKPSAPINETPKFEPVVNANGAVSREIAPYGEMVKTPGVGQAHHLNQDAAFSSVINKNDGLAIRLEGNAFTEVGSSHYNAHNSLEGFFNQFRKSGELYGEVPTNLQYSKALLNSLQKAGLSRQEALEAVRASIGQRVNAGQLGGLEIPRVPGKLGQVKPDEY